ANHRFASAGIADIARDAVLPRHQIELVCLGIVGPALLDRLLLLGQELQLQRLDNRLRDFVLEGKYVFEVAIVALGPDVAPRRAIDQLRCDPHSSARLPYTALEDVANLELPRDLRHIDMLALERERGVTRRDPERRNFGEIGDDVFADAIRKVFLFRLTTHIGERKDAN